MCVWVHARIYMCVCECVYVRVCNLYKKITKYTYPCHAGVYVLNMPLEYGFLWEGDDEPTHSPSIFMEVSSLDTWERYRVEVGMVWYGIVSFISFFSF